MHRKILVLLGALMVLAACGSGSKSATTATTATTMAGYGTAGTAAMADRTITVNILASLQYDPATISVSPGETVEFKVTNQTTGIHEFVLGNSAEQAAYERTMVGMGTTPMVMPDRANILNLQAGVTKELAWTFPSTDGATVIYGSHEPGDYAHGLRGTITVTAAAASGSPTTMGMTSTTAMSGMTSTTGMGGMSGMTSTTSMSGMSGMTSTTMGMG